MIYHHYLRYSSEAARQTGQLVRLVPLVNSLKFNVFAYINVKRIVQQQAHFFPADSLKSSMLLEILVQTSVVMINSFDC